MRDDDVRAVVVDLVDLLEDGNVRLPDDLGLSFIDRWPLLRKRRGPVTE